MPLESEYADDADFLNEDKQCLEALLPIAKCTFEEWNLFINEEKTEFTHVFLASKGQKMPDNNDKLLAGNESWRSSKILGSLLCSEADIAARCISGNIAFNSFKNVWCKNRKISLHKKLRVYEAQVVSVILYNCCSWSPTKKSLEKLDICHRKHLRNILNIKWPQGVISNKNLYERCNSTPLSDRVASSRWRMLGHILRSSELTPASLALFFAVDGSHDLKGRLGRPRCNLLNTLRDDLAKRKLSLDSKSDIYVLRNIASNRVQWRNLY